MNKETEQQNISEPVISFINTFEANPKRFRFKKYPSEGMVLIDTVTNKKFIYEYNIMFGCYCFSDELRLYMRDNIKGEYLGWMTKEEKTYVEEYFTNYLKDRKTKLKSIKDTRKRAQLSRDYC